MDSVFTSKNWIEFRNNLERSGGKNNRIVTKLNAYWCQALFKCFICIKALIFTKPHFMGAILLQFLSKKIMRYTKVMCLRYPACK